MNQFLIKEFHLTAYKKQNQKKIDSFKPQTDINERFSAFPFDVHIVFYGNNKKSQNRGLYEVPIYARG